MPQPFTPGSNALARGSLLALLLLIPGLMLTAFLLVRSDYSTGRRATVQQPVPFSHEHHVDGLGLECAYCHTSATESPYAGMPDTHTCMTCHSQVWTNAPNLEIVRQSYRTDRPIAWNRVHDLADYVRFSHQAHVNNGIGCTTCHGQIDEMPLVWQEETLFMQWCLDCHRDPADHLRPAAAIMDADWHPPPDQAEQGARLADEYRIRSAEPLTECSICHQ